MEDGTGAPSLVPRCCHIVRWADFNGYGFNLHAEKGKAGQYIGKVDSGSPAEAAGLRQGDRIVEVNGINIGNENHQQVVSRIKSGGDETRLLVVDYETDQQYKTSMTVVRGDLPEVCFLTAARDDEIKPSSNGSAFTPAPSVPEPPAPSVPAASPSHPVRQCRLRKWADFNGYGFNLHAEKDKPGQYIGAIDPDSPAEKGGLREGDRIIEVNEENIEGLSHAQVIERVKAGGDRTSLLVVDRLADAHYKDLGQRVSSDPAVMTGVTVIVTPATSKGEEEAITAVVAQAVESTPEPPAPSEEEAVANGHEPEKEEEEEQKEEEEEEEKKEEVVEEQVAVVTSTTFDVTNDVTQADEVTGADEEVKKEEEEEEEGVTGLEDYEQVEVVAASVAVAAYSAPSATQAEDDLGAVSYGMNGGAEVPEPEPEPEPRRVVEPEPAPTPTPTPAPVVAPVTIPLARAQQPEPEPEPAVIRSSVTTSSKAPAPSGPAMGGDLHLFMSAAEMKERLKARKKQDPRFHKTSFEAKSKMFEKM